MSSLHHVFIDLVKITKQHFTPEIKMIKRFSVCRVALRFPDYVEIGSVKSMDKLKFIRNFQGRKMCNKIFNRQKFWSEDRFCKQRSKMFPEIKNSSPVWKDQCHFIQFRMLVINFLCYFLKKCFH